MTLETFAEAAIPWMTGVLFRSLILLAAAGVAMILLRRSSAAVRHLALALTLGALLLLPLFSALLPSWSVPVPLPPGFSLLPFEPVSAMPVGSANSLNTRKPGVRVITPASPPVVPAPKIHPSAPKGSHAAVSAATPPPVASSPPAPATISRFDTLSWPTALFTIWSLVAALLLARVVAGMVRLRQAAGRYLQLAEGELSSQVSLLAKSMGVRRRVRLLVAPVSEQGVTPMTWGYLHPILLLPAQATQWPQERLRAVVLHEMAHIRRGDWPINLLAWIVRALYWPNPLAWLLTRRIQAESEHASDDRVLLSGIEPPDYAAHLLAVVQAMHSSHSSLRAAVPMARHRTLVESRLRAILARGRARQGAARITVALALLTVGGLLAVMAALHPWAKITTLASPSLPVRPAPQWKTTLSNGVTVALVGVTYAEPKRYVWWKHNSHGSLITRQLPENKLVYHNLAPTQKGRVFAIQLTYARKLQSGGGYEDQPSIAWRFTPNVRTPTLSRTQQETSTVGGKTTILKYLPQAFDASTSDCRLQVAVAAGRWRTAAVRHPQARADGKAYAVGGYPLHRNHRSAAWSEPTRQAQDA